MADVLAGSFVTYLVQRDGAERDSVAIATFMKLYRNGCAPCVYGKTFQQIEEDWMAFLAADPKPRTKPLASSGQL
jgi:hypothetical protein